MSTSPSTNIAGPYVLTGSGQTLSVPFYFLDQDHLKVTSLDSIADLSEETLANPADYSVTGAGNEAGGSITLTGGVAGQIIVITRLVPITQILDYIEGDGFPAATHEQALDKLTMITQMIAENLARCVQFPVTSQGDKGQEIPVTALRKSMGWSFDSNGDLVVGSGLGASTAVVAATRTLGVAAAGSTDFHLIALGADHKASWVWVMVHVPKDDGDGDVSGAEGYVKIERAVIRRINDTYSVEMEREIGKANGSTESIDITWTTSASGVTIAIDGTNLADQRDCELRVLAFNFSDDGDTTITDV